MESGKQYWKGLSVTSFIVAAITLYMGLDKMFQYDNGELFPHEYHNAYVGGDAYNYIINGNYATGFFVLATLFALLGATFIVLYYLSKIGMRKEIQAPTNTEDYTQLTNRVTLLSYMVRVKENILGDIESTTAKFGFYDFEEKLNLKKEEYEKLIKDMRHEKLITIDLNGYAELSKAIISATNDGVQFMLTNKKQNRTI